MGYLLDLIIAAILVLSIWLSYKNGFIKTVLSALSFFIALIIAFSLQPKLSEHIINLPMVDGVREKVRSEFVKMAPQAGSNEDYDSEKLIQEEPEGFKRMLQLSGIDEGEIRLKYEGWKQLGAEKAADAMVDYVAEPLIKSLVSVISFIIIFLASLIVLKLLVLILDNVFKLPVLRQANKLLGLILGIVLGLFRAYVFGAAATLLIPIIQSNHENLVIGNSFLFKFFFGNANVLITFFK